MNSRLEIKIVTSDDDYDKAMNVRRAVFVHEEKIPESKEFDGNDHCATHVLALLDDKPIGTMRIRYFNGFVKFERMCVLPEFRKMSLNRLCKKGSISARKKALIKSMVFAKKNSCLAGRKTVSRR